MSVKKECSPVKYVGSCLCGAVSFEISGDIEQVIHCHCDICKKAHGAAFASFGVVAQSDFQWFGHEYIKAFKSSPEAERKFCKNCGSSLQWHKYDDLFNNGRISFALGLLDSSYTPKEEVHYFEGRRASWYLR
nr:GFA family protein [Vibrio mediterranei]